MKRELAIRDRVGQWRARQEETLFQKRMIAEWKQRETDRRIGARARCNRRSSPIELRPGVSACVGLGMGEWMGVLTWSCLLVCVCRMVEQSRAQKRQDDDEGRRAARAQAQRQAELDLMRDQRGARLVDTWEHKEAAKAQQLRQAALQAEREKKVPRANPPPCDRRRPASPRDGPAMARALALILRCVLCAWCRCRSNIGKRWLRRGRRWPARRTTGPLRRRHRPHWNASEPLPSKNANASASLRYRGNPLLSQLLCEPLSVSQQLSASVRSTPQMIFFSIV